MNPKYLARPSDGSIWSLNDDGETYSSKDFKDKFPDNITHKHSLKSLINSGFYEVSENQFPELEKIGNEYYEFIIWQSRSDGHGGSKGGTKEEFIEHKKRVSEWEKLKNSRE